MRRASKRAVVLIITMAGVSLLPSGGSSASCAGPTLTVVGTPTLGRSLVVEGRAFVEGCNDTGSRDVFGCSTSTPEPEIPFEDVRLVLRQGERSWVLGTEDAGTAEDNKLGHVTWDVQVPSDVRPGPARLVADVARLPVVVRR